MVLSSDSMKAPKGERQINVKGAVVIKGVGRVTADDNPVTCGAPEARYLVNTGAAEYADEGGQAEAAPALEPETENVAEPEPEAAPDPEEKPKPARRKKKKTTSKK